MALAAGVYPYTITATRADGVTNTFSGSVVVGIERIVQLGSITRSKTVHPIKTAKAKTAVLGSISNTQTVLPVTTARIQVAQLGTINNSQTVLPIKTSKNKAAQLGIISNTQIISPITTAVGEILPVSVESTPSGTINPGDLVSIQLANGDGTETLSCSAGSVSIFANDGTTLQFLVPDPATFGDLTLTYNSAIEFTVTQGSDTATFDMPIEPVDGELFGEITSIDAGGIYADDTLNVGDYAHIRNISAGVTVDVATGAFTVTQAGSLEYALYDGVWSAYATETFDAPDITAPVITLLGDSIVTLTEGDVYADAGATASDDQDGDVTTDIVTINSVDSNTVGTYTVTYNVTDTAGNIATEVVRTVNVVSATADMVPDIFDLGLDVTGSEPNTLVQRQFTVTGIDNGQTINITALGSATLSAVTAQLNDVITVSLTSDDFGGMVSGGADINGVSDTFSITTREAVTPTVQSQPTNQTVEEGKTVIFVAGFTNAANYQWFDASDDSVIPGATGITYNFVTTLADNASSYYCVATSPDGATAQTNTVTLTVTAVVVVQAPVMPVDTSITVDENTTAVGTFIANSGDAPITYSLSGTDADSFSIGLTTGTVSFLVAPDYETKANYTFTVVATNTGGTDSQEITVTVGNVFDTPPVINTGNELTDVIRIGGLYSDPDWTASDEAGDVSITWSGSVDVNTIGTYTRTATATNGAGVTTEDFTIQVTEEPTIDFIPALLQTDRKHVKVFKDRGNRFRVTLSHNQTPIDLSLFASFELYGLTDEPLTGNAIDWNDGNGVINISAGDRVQEFGKFKTTLIGYHSEYPEGVVLWHPTLTDSRVTVTVLQ